MKTAETNTSPGNLLSSGETRYLETLLSKKKYPALEQHCRAMLLKAPSMNSLNYLLGLSLSGQQKFEAAIESFNVFIAEKNDYADAYLNLGIAYERTQKLAEALTSYNEARQLAPHNPVIHNKIGVILQKTGAFDEAASCFECAILYDPDCAEYHLHLAMMCNNLGKFEKAVDEYKEATKLKPDYIEAYHFLGRLHEHQARPDEALKCYQKIAEIKPSDINNCKYLANLYFETGQYQNAIECYHKADQFNPGDPNIYGSLGAVYNRLGRYEEALDFTQRALQIKPDLNWVLNNFSKSLGVYSSDLPITSQLVTNIIRCFESPDIDSTVIARSSSSAIKIKLDDLIKRPLLEDLDKIEGATFQLLVAHLSDALVSDIDVEEFLCELRRQLLDCLADGRQLCSRSEVLLEALTYQARLNEYLWVESIEEQLKVEGIQEGIERAIVSGDLPDKWSLFILGAYRPVYQVKVLRDWALNNKPDKDDALQKFIQAMFVKPEYRKVLSQEIKPATSIDNEISLAVRQQYEENPYPRWWNLPRQTPKLYVQKVQSEILPNTLNISDVKPNPRVLIAGCGTGRQALNAAGVYKNATVLAVDLSLSSLAYAQSKAEDFGITNVEFRQADILNLGELEEEFDIIECSGVLHHMEQPEAGLKTLLGLLSKDGFLKLGLYSEPARQSVSELRQTLAEDGVDVQNVDVREFRVFLKQNYSDLFERISKSMDFYSTSALRDLVLHVHEHQYTIPKIQSMLERHQLDFLGFVSNDSKLKISLLEQYPDDPYCINLHNWHQMELSRPKIFAGMYQFWCRKCRV